MNDHDNRYTVLNREVGVIGQKVNTIMENCLPHIEAEVKSVKRWCMGILGSVVVAVLIGACKMLGLI